MSLEDAIQKIISSRPDLTREEVLRMVKEKERKAKGFLTTESAARTLAAELGIETSEISMKEGISIGNLISGLSDVTVMGRVIFVYPLRGFVRPDGTEGKMRHLIVADKTGDLKVNLWDDKAVFLNIEGSIGQIAKFSHGYIRRGFGGKLELNVGSRGSLEISPPNVHEAEYPPLTFFVKRISQIRGDEESVSVVGTVGDMYPITIFKREDGSEGKVRRLELKDGGDGITVVLWNNKVDDLADIEEGDCLEILQAKVRKRIDGSFELHIDNSTGVAVLDKKPPDFDRPLMRLTKIRDLKPKIRNIKILARVMHKSKIKSFTTRRGETGFVSTLLISDDSGSAQLNLWNEKARLSERVKIGDAILIENAHVSQGFRALSLNLDIEGLLTLNPSIDEARNLPHYEEKITQISDLESESGMVVVEGRVLTLPVIEEIATSKDEKVKMASFELADDTGKIEVCLWREAADLAVNLSVNDRIRTKYIYVNRDSSGQLRLSSSSLTSLDKL